MFAHVTEIELAQVASPLGEFDGMRLTKFYARLIAEVGADLPSKSEALTCASRRARRRERQRASRMVRVLSTARRTVPADLDLEVAA